MHSKWSPYYILRVNSHIKVIEFIHKRRKTNKKIKRSTNRSLWPISIFVFKKCLTSYYLTKISLPWIRLGQVMKKTIVLKCGQVNQNLTHVWHWYTPSCPRRSAYTISCSPSVWLFEHRIPYVNLNYNYNLYKILIDLFPLYL
jgi:hypothetical protein